jgi:hypothetical protein
MTLGSRPRQDSSLEVEGRRIDVSSELLLDPEPLVMTTVCIDAVEVRRRHEVIPERALTTTGAPSTVALRAALHAVHLRAVRDLLAGEKGAGATTANNTIATLVFDDAGAIVEGSGEGQVPAPWLRASYLLGGIVDALGRVLGVGELVEAELRGDGLSAIASRRAGLFSVSFTERAERRALHGDGR